MKRWLLRICVFLLLGAIVNVAVVWGLARWSSGPGLTYRPTATVVHDAEGQLRLIAHGFEIESGLPVRALEVGPDASLIRPIWPGFAINTVFYAVILGLLFAGPFVLRWRRRIRRGLCPQCAYDLRGSAEATACPECGAAVNRMAG